MIQYNDIWYTIGGKMFSISELLPNQEDPSTPLHLIESYNGHQLFCNPWGAGSRIALQAAIDLADKKALRASQPALTLDQGIKVIEALHETLEYEVAQGPDSEFLQTYIRFKGVPISEILEDIKALRSLLHDFQGEQLQLKAMLGTDSPAQFFATHTVIPKFGIMASGNLGLFETILLIWSAILAQAAKNGNQFSLLVKPSMYDCLFHEMIHWLPEHVRSAFSRITWRSDQDITPDADLIGEFINKADGAIYFGNKNTLDQLKIHLVNESHHHYFYSDHFPIMLVFPDMDTPMLQAAAKQAVSLAFRRRGEACLSLQDVFAHEKVYERFMYFVAQEWQLLKQTTTDPLMPETQLANYSTSHLAEMEQLRQKLNGNVMGEVFPQAFRTDLLVNYNVAVDDWVLSTENAAPLLCVASFTDSDQLLFALQSHIQNSTSDKFIYAAIVGSTSEKSVASIGEVLSSISHRIEWLTSVDGIQDFVTYYPGVPHCSSISFLADMFGLPHQSDCYWGYWGGSKK